jgi:prevent-host-death family protein
MSKHSIAETKNKLSELIERARSGEEITITRHGQPVATINPVPSAARRITDADLDWLDRHRVGRKIPKEDAGTFVSRMRDEEWNR